METEAYPGVATRAAENLASPPAFSMVDRIPYKWYHRASWRAWHLPVL